MATIPAHVHTHTQKLFVIFEDISGKKYISLNNYTYIHIMGFPHGSAGKESTCNVGDLGSIPGLGISPGEGNGYPLQYTGPENPMDRVACQIGRAHV